MPQLLAFDLGATSGRAILGRLEGERLITHEVHRFRNEPLREHGQLHWDLEALWREMQVAIARAGQVDTIGVDTWGVDYGLVGDDGALLEKPFHYRDSRTDGMMERALAVLGRERVYDTTGIQFMPINTLYQLYAASQRTPQLLAAAKYLLTIPDLLNFRLTGRAVCEYTNATTTQFLDRRTGAWATGLLRDLGIPTHLLPPIVQPGTVLGEYQGAVVVAPACHDTGSAVAAIRSGGSTAFLSSGTWSLLGTEVAAAVATPQALRLNFTNEGGVCGTIRLLKNITGLWLLEECRRAWDPKLDWNVLLAAAESAAPFRSLVNPDDPAFVRPEDMPRAIAEYCRRTGQPAPENEGACARAILEGLALKYRVALEQLESLTGARYDTIRVIGGGSQNALLNRFTAEATGRTVLAGPAEATALGNLAMQLTGSGAVASLDAARRLIEFSFPPRRFEGQSSADWESAYNRLRAYCEPT
jgi:rhamnulokinase